ncbi:MAG: preprotein translocase subunit YajC [Alphaproteobacteria bacterium]|nr:preprotein translocase subunit YajC [Alphaproteobacteria bacterium]
MSEGLIQFVPLLAIFAILYFFLIRPQNRRMKEHQQMVAGLQRGDTVVFSGGLIGKVKKLVGDNEAVVEVAEGVQLRIVKHSVTEVRSKSEPAND